MKCISCAADIPPAFVHSIATNVCPGCGNAIMSDEHKGLLNELKEAMAKMPNDPEGLAGWLLSHYDLRKIGSGEPTEFHRKKKSAIPQDKIKIHQDNISEFSKRAGVDPALLQASKNRKNKFQLLASAINQGNLDDLYGDNLNDSNNYDNNNDNEEDYGGEDYGGEDYEGEGEDDYEALMMPMMSKEAMLSGNGAPLSSAETALLMQQISNSNIPNNNSTEIVRNERFKRLQKQETILNGGADKKNGFRRAE